MLPKLTRILHPTSTYNVQGQREHRAHSQNRIVALFDMRNSKTLSVALVMKLTVMKSLGLGITEPLFGIVLKFQRPH